MPILSPMPPPDRERAPLGKRWWLLDAYAGGLVIYLIMRLTVGDRFWIILLITYIAHLLLPLAALALPVALVKKRWGSVALQTVCAIAFLLAVRDLLASGNRVPLSPDQGSITALTYNLGDGLASPEELVPLLRASGADIIGLQELTETVATAIDSDLKRLYPYQVLRPLGIPGKGLLSRYPVIDTEWLDANPERPDLRATIDVNGTRIVIFVVHPPPPQLTWSGIQSRHLSVEQIDALIDAIKTTSEPVVVLGDFNITEWHDAHARLESIGLRDTFDIAGRGAGFTSPSRFANRNVLTKGLGGMPLIPFMRLDYVWVSPEWQIVDAWVGNDAGSDHLPVLAQVQLSPIANAASGPAGFKVGTQWPVGVEQGDD